MDSGHITRALRRGWPLVLVCVALGLIAGLAYLRTAPETYTARTDVYVSTVGGLSVSELSAGSNFAQQQAQNLSLIATRQRVLGPVVTRLKLDETAEELGDAMTATVPADTSMILLEVSNSSPREAAAIANAVSASLVNTTADLLPPARRGAPAIRVQIVQPAAVPNSPSEPGTLPSLLVGLSVGLLLGLALALALEAHRQRRLSDGPDQAASATPQLQPQPQPQPAATPPGQVPVDQTAATSAWSWGASRRS